MDLRSREGDAMKPISELTDLELSEAIAIEVMGWTEFLVSFGVYYWRINPRSRARLRQNEYSPATDDPQSEVALDKAAEILGGQLRAVEVAHCPWFHRDKPFEVAIDTHHTGGENTFAYALCATRPRARSECALAAVREWRKKKGE